MEARLWRELYRMTWDVAARGQGRRPLHPDAMVVLTLLWAALNHRPISWAVQRRNWPVWVQRWHRRFPSSSTMSRRLRRESVRGLLEEVLELAQADLPRSLWTMIDGKPLVIGGGSKDTQAGYGRAVGGKAKGYKLHVLLHPSGRIEGFRVASMNVPEQRMAARLLQSAGVLMYVLADGNYDSNHLHAIVDARGAQLVAIRRKPGTGLGRRRHQPGRLRSFELTEGPSSFGRETIRQRDQIERFLGNLSSFSAGLGPLPAWVRTYARVRRWVTAKLIINAVRIANLRATRVA